VTTGIRLPAISSRKSAGFEETIAREAAWAEESLRFLMPLFA
jgi:hypothetical protein